MNGRGEAVRPEHVYALMEEFNRFSRSVYGYMLGSSELPTREAALSQFRLEASNFTVPEDLPYTSREAFSNVPPQEIVKR
jgi:hypothetical protein